MTKPIVLLYHSDAVLNGVTDCQVAIEDGTRLKFYPTGQPSFWVDLTALKAAIPMLEAQRFTETEEHQEIMKYLEMCLSMQALAAAGPPRNMIVKLAHMLGCGETVEKVYAMHSGAGHITRATIEMHHDKQLANVYVHCGPCLYTFTFRYDTSGQNRFA